MQFNLPSNSGSTIKVIGVGGGGSNAVNYMHQQGINGVDFIVCNTDNQALEASSVPVRIQLGTTLTAGQGAGSIPEIGKNAAIENLDDVLAQLGDNTNMVFVTAGMGGGTGTGAAPVIAKACKDLDILTVGIITVPFNFEGRRRANQAGAGLEAMRAAVDTLLVIRNDKLRELFGNLTLKQAFSNADEVLCTAAKGIAEVITLTGDINVDMNDVKTVMRDSGAAIMGAGSASGEGRAMTAVSEALESPLLNDSDITGANFVLLNITYGTQEILMDEISEITDYIQDQAGATAEVIWGYGHDEQLGEKICVTVIATGFEATAKLPEGPTVKKHTLQTEAREITSLLDSPLDSPEDIRSNESTSQEEEPHLKQSDATPATPSAYDEAPDPRDLPLTNTFVAEDITSETASAAPDLFGPVKPDSGEEITLIHREVVEPEVPEFTVRTETTMPVTTEATEEAAHKDSVERIGDYNILNLDDDQEENLFPEKLSDISFTNEQEATDSDTPSEPTENDTTEPAEDDLAMEPARFQAQPIPTPRPELIQTDAEPTRLTPPNAPTESADLAQRMALRHQSIQEYTKRLRTPSGLTELENEPAYKRRNILLSPTPASSESQATRLSIDEETGGLKTDNPFLHDNVD